MFGNFVIKAGDRDSFDRYLKFLDKATSRFTKNKTVLKSVQEIKEYLDGNCRGPLLDNKKIVELAYENIELNQLGGNRKTKLLNVMAGSLNSYNMTDKVMIHNLGGSTNTLRRIFSDIAHEKSMLYSASINNEEEPDISASHRNIIINAGHDVIRSNIPFKYENVRYIFMQSNSYQGLSDDDKLEAMEIVDGLTKSAFDRNDKIYAFKQYGELVIP